MARLMWLNQAIGERGRNRTYNLVIKSHLLCQLSYAPVSVGKAAEKTATLNNIAPAPAIVLS
jgi:hypothetical protein